MRESRFVIQKRIQNQSSDARIRLKTVRGAREKLVGQRPRHRHPRVEAVWRPCATRPNQPFGPVWNTCPTWPLGWGGLFLLAGNSLSLLHFKFLHLPLFVSKKKKLKSRQIFSLQFSQLPNTITFSYEVGIECFKLKIVRDRVLYLFQVILQLFDWFSEWSTQKTEPAREIKVVIISWWFHLFKPSICLGFLLLYVCVCLVNAIEKDSFTINLIEKSN